MAYTQDSKPLELTALTTLASDDTIIVGDTSDTSEVVKTITKDNLIADIKTTTDTYYAPALGADDNYVTDAEKAIIAATTASFTLADETKLDGIAAGAEVNVNADWNSVAGDSQILNKPTISGSNTGDQTITLTSDVTGSGTGSFATTIANNAVTLAKMADVATGTVFYRKTASTGDPEVQTLATLKTDLGLTGTNSGDQTFIVGITGTKAQFDTAVTDGNFMYVGDAPTSHTHLLAAITDVTASATELNVLDGIPGTLTATELGYVDGVTSAIQTQLNAKLDSSAYDDATAAEVNTGTSTAKYVSPDSLAGSNLGIRYATVTLNGSTALTTSEKVYFRIPPALTGMNLVSVSATVGTGAAGSSSSGTPTFTVKNVTDANQMLSTSLTVDAGEYTSATAAVPAVINASFDDVVTDDLIEVAVTTAGTGVTFCTITMGFALP